MSWDATVVRDEKGSPVGTYSEVCDWIRSQWKTEEWSDCVNQPASCYGEGYSTEISVGTKHDEVRMKYYNEVPMPTDPDKMMEWWENQPSFDVSPDESVSSVSLAVRGGGDPIPDIRAFCLRHGLIMFDAQSGETIDFKTDTPEDTYGEWKDFRDRVVEEQDE